ncbi:MAG: urease accessory protein [Acidobacteria bacterium]|nr:urease accessory protein [Acidobacteriota bacterium]MBI3664289.1 urease accessory protein [Acidobacteriota bacterium]
MDTSATITLALGFVLGLRHATDADHIVAVSTLVSESGGARRGAKIGAFWGAGHLLTVFVAGSVLVLLRLRIPPRVEWALELIVALVLIGLGVSTIFKCLTGRYHFHQHQHGERAHAHLHFHAASQPNHEHNSHSPQLSHNRAPLLLGMAHGLAGTAGLALLVLTSIPTRTLGILYLVVFGLGALAGMAAFGMLLGGALALPLARQANRLKWLNGMRLVAGTSSGALGLVLAWRALLPQAWPF